MMADDGMEDGIWKTRELTCGIESAAMADALVFKVFVVRNSLLECAQTCV